MTKLARYFLDCGHDVRVLTAGERSVPETLPVDIPEDQILYTKWNDIEKPVRAVKMLMTARPGTSQTPGGRAPGPAASASPGPRASGDGGSKRLLSLGSEIYFGVRHVPDKQIGWLGHAVRRGRQLVRAWQPDIVYASGPPFTSLIVGKAVAAYAGVEWIAELRDPWSDSGYLGTDPLGLHQRLQASRERRTLQSATCIVATADTVTQLYGERYGKPATTVYNGYDDLSGRGSPDNDNNGAPADAPVVITYTGTVYAGKRDPRPLFNAISLLSEDERRFVRVDFYGCPSEEIYPRAEACGVRDCVTVNPGVAYQTSLNIQQTSDALLLLQWNNPKENMHIPAKLFEYFGSLRPIIGMGFENGVPARLIRERGAGVYANDPQQIKDFLSDLIARKRRLGHVPALPRSAVEGLSRREQCARLMRFIEQRGQPASAANSNLSGQSPRAVIGSDPVPIDFSPKEKPRLLVVCDAEAEFDWLQGFDANSRSIAHLRHIDRVQSILERHGVAPVYVVDFPVADQPAEADYLARYIREDRAILGAHLQPWAVPPCGEAIRVSESYPGNLPADIERQKLRTLTDRIRETFGITPRIYKAGRYGLGQNTGRTITELGYEIDLSAAPPLDFSHEGGPDFSAFDCRPFWFDSDRRLLGIPSSGAFVGQIGRRAGAIYRLSKHRFLEPFHLPGLLARLRLIERLRLSNEGYRIDKLKRLSRDLVDRGCRVLVFSFHSPSVVPGMTPYVRDDNDLEQFLQCLDQFLAFAIQDLGAQPSTPFEILEMARAQRQQIQDHPGTAEAGATPAHAPAI
jgi:hypothetical protein